VSGRWPNRPARRSRATGAAALACAAAALAGGCGGDEPPDPATLAPPDAPLYVESIAKPEGDAKEALEGALSKLLNSDDPGGVIVDRLQNELDSEQTEISYSEDIEPGLGERAGLFVETFTDDGVSAVAVAVTDAEAARALIDKAAASLDDQLEDATYKGVPYRVGAGGAAGIVGDFLVVGTEPGFRAAVDASQGDSLAEDEEFASARETFESDFEDAGEEQIVSVYADIPGALDGVADAGDITPEERSIVEGALGGATDAPVLAAIGASDDSLGFDLSTPGADGAAAPTAAETALLGELPGDSWAALGFNDVGDAVSQGLQQLQSADVPGVPPGGLPEVIRDQTGVDVESLVSWIGDVALFARGTSLLSVGGGAVIETTDPEASAQSLTDLGELLSGQLQGEAEVGPLDLEQGGEGFSIQLPGAPDQIHFAQREDRVAITYGDDATEEAFAPSEPLAGSEAFENAEGSLGADLDLTGFVEFEPILELAGVAGASDDPGYAAAEPYLAHLDFLAFGGRVVEDRALTRVAVGLK